MVDGAFMEPFSASPKLVQTVKDWNISSKVTDEINWVPQLLSQICYPNLLPEITCWKAKDFDVWMKSVNSLHALYICLFDLPAV